MVKSSPNGEKWVIVNNENNKFVGFLSVCSLDNAKKKVKEINKNYKVYGELIHTYKQHNGGWKQNDYRYKWKISEI